jgi:hypothetical protein
MLQELIKELGFFESCEPSCCVKVEGAALGSEVWMSLSFKDCDFCACKM